MELKDFRDFVKKIINNTSKNTKKILRNKKEKIKIIERKRDEVLDKIENEQDKNKIQKALEEFIEENLNVLSN